MSSPPVAKAQPREGVAALTLGALGVVFGDIGTSGNGKLQIIDEPAFAAFVNKQNEVPDG